MTAAARTRTVTDLSFVYDDGGRAAAGLGTDPVVDCTIRAIAIVTRTPYAKVLEHFREAIARDYRAAPDHVEVPDPERDGLMHFQVHTYMRRAGWTWTRVRTARTHTRMYLGEDPLPFGRVLVVLDLDDPDDPDGHTTALIDGVIHDTWNPDGLCVVGYFAPPATARTATHTRRTA